MQRQVNKVGVDVSTGEYTAGEVSIVDAELITTTLWTCPNPECRTRWKKLGNHAGDLKSCATCGARFFLRGW